MYSDVKKNLRTQGKYSSVYVEKNSDVNSRDKCNSDEKLKKNSKRNSSSSNRKSFGNESEENESPVKYEDSSSYTFSELEEETKPVEISADGEFILSETDNGRSSIIYKSKLYDEEEANRLYSNLYEVIDWQEHSIVIRGQAYKMPRMVAWCGPLPYSYSGVTMDPCDMPPDILSIKDNIEKHLKIECGINVTFNSVLLNLYRDGKDSVAWHSDDELSMGICPTIASLSLGETRKFEIRCKENHPEMCNAEKQKHNPQYLIYLVNGSLLVMNGAMQDDWQHRVPKEYHDKDTRINLTFRTVFPLDESQIHQKKMKSAKENSVDFPVKSSSAKNLNRIEEHFPPLSSTPISSVETASQVLGLSYKSENAEFGGDGMLRQSDINNLNISTDFKPTHEKNIVSMNESTFNESGCLESSNNSCNMSVELENSNSDKSLKENTQSHKKGLNTEAPVFVPSSQRKEKESHLKSLDLKYLLGFHVEKLPNNELQDFTNCLKLKVTEVLSTFPNNDQDILKLLCTISDGSQSERNQKLITRKIVNILKKKLDFSAVLKYDSVLDNSFENPDFDSNRSCGNHGNEVQGRGSEFYSIEYSNKSDYSESERFNRNSKCDLDYSYNKLKRYSNKKILKEYIPPRFSKGTEYPSNRSYTNSKFSKRFQKDYINRDNRTPRTNNGYQTPNSTHQPRTYDSHDDRQ